MTSGEPPSRKLTRPVLGQIEPHIGQLWENDIYYGVIRRFKSGFFFGSGPYAIISITAIDESSHHDWREFQQIKNYLVGEEWEAIELYPAESRLVDPSNRFYLWCVPKGILRYGLPGFGRYVEHPLFSAAPQRPFPIGEGKI